MRERLACSRLRSLKGMVRVELVVTVRIDSHYDRVTYRRSTFCCSDILRSARLETFFFLGAAYCKWCWS